MYTASQKKQIVEEIINTLTDRLDNDEADFFDDMGISYQRHCQEQDEQDETKKFKYKLALSVVLSPLGSKECILQCSSRWSTSGGKRGLRKLLDFQPQLFETIDAKV